MNTSDSFRLKGRLTVPLFYLAGVFLFAHLTHAQYASVSQTSDPVGFLDHSETYEVGTRIQSVLPELSKDGYVFGYWTVNGWRVGDLTGRAITQPHFLVEGTLNLVAHYFEEDLDSDEDGLDDWYEYRNFGDLTQTLADDPDNDGYSNGAELMMGQQSTVVDAVDDGGISSRDSSSFVYGDSSLNAVKVSSQPTGFVEGALAYFDENASFQSEILNGERYGHTFSYWTVNDVRQVGLTGVASSDARVSVSGETEVVAHYFPTDEDSDTDGIPDWFEYNQFGDLSQSKEDDADGDSFDNGQENFLGQEAMIRDLVVDGGISSRDSSMFVFGDFGLAQYSIASNPVGFVDGEVAYGQPGDEITTDQQYGEKFGYRFAYWTINGERQAGPTGLALSSVNRTLNDGDELVAHYIPEGQDSDQDGIPDWFELNQFGDLSQGPEDDPDQDLYSNKVEVQQGNEALIRDVVMDGGISSRDSSMIAYFIQANRVPDGIVLEPNYFYKESPVGELVGDLQALDYDDPTGTGSYTYELVSGLGDLDNDKFSVTGDQVFTAVQANLGQYSIRVQVTDGEGATYSQAITINGVSDPYSDNDSDGLTFEDEQNIGTDPENADSDGDGFSDGFEYTRDLDPLSAQDAIVINRPFFNEQIERNSTLEVSISFESKNSQGSAARWVYKLNESFSSSETPVYEATELSISGWLGSLRDGEHTVYVGLLDPAGGDTIIAEDSVHFELIGGDIVPFYYLSNNSGEGIEPLKFLTGSDLEDGYFALIYEEYVHLNYSIYPVGNDGSYKSLPPVLVPVFQDEHELWRADTVNALPVIRNQVEIEDYFEVHQILPEGRLSLPPFLLSPIAQIDLSDPTNLEQWAQGYDRIFYQELASPKNWTPYESFDQTVLDGNLWDSGYFNGGVAPSIENGKAVFSGSSPSGDDPFLIPDYLGVDEVPEGGGHSFFLLNDENAFGVELEVTIPSNQNTQEVGFFIDLFDRNLEHHELIELRWGPQGLEWSWPNESYYGESFYQSIPANLDQTYKISVVLNAEFYILSLDGEEIAQVAATLLPKHWLIGTFQDNEESFRVEIDNVKAFKSTHAEPQLWSLSIEIDESNPSTDKPDLLVDMAGFVYEGHFGDYWHQVLGIPLLYDSESGYEQSPSGWFEKSYSTDLTGMENLYNSHPIIERGGIKIDFVSNKISGAELPLNSVPGSYIAQLALNPSTLPYLRTRLLSVSNYQGEELPEGDYFSLSTGLTLTSGTTSFDFDDSSLGEDEFTREVQLNFGTGVGFNFDYYTPQTFNVIVINEEALNANKPPHSLTLSNSSIAENKPAGTLVGTFSAIDPEDGLLTYELIASASQNTQLFNLSTDGKLSIKRALNFETDPQSYQLVVLVVDDEGQSISKEFKISLVNVIEDFDGDGIEDHADTDDDGDGFTDKAELDYGSDPRNAESLPNRAPVSLTLDRAQILENRPIGTVVGTFAGSDPDGDVLTFSLENEVKNFKLSEKGVLSTARSLDYETDDSNFTLDVVVSDDEGYQLAKSFTISLINVVEDLDGDSIEDHYDLDDDGDGFSDKVEIAYPSDPRDPKSTPNRAPSKLNLTNDSIFENEPVGTVVGFFEGLDPDGDRLSFTLTKAVPEFNLTKDGNLTLARVLDFEVDSQSYTLSIKVSDGTALALSKNFTINLLNVVEDLDGDGEEDHFDLDDDGDGFEDEFELSNGFDPRDSTSKVYKPLIETLDAVHENGTNYVLRAKIHADGGLQPTSYGFVQGTSLADMSEVIYVSTPISDQNEFGLDTSALISGKSYFFKAFAENAAGLTFGNVKKFTVSDNVWWASAEVYDGGWRSNWLGVFLPNANGWIFHLDYGWAYVESDKVDGLWLWLNERGWVWTNPESSSFLWSANTSDWLYPIKANGKVKYFDYSNSTLLEE